MDFKKSNSENQSCFSYSKSIKIYLALLTTLSFFGACSSKQKSSESTEMVYFDSLEGEIHQMSRVGQNNEAYFSPSANKLVFVRENTKEHRTPQIYERNLVDKTERRISFNIGENHTPQYHPTKAWIIYSSSSDEIIEKVDVHPAMKNLGMKVPESNPNSDYPQDVYISAEDGSDIKRITNEKGFDGLATFSRDGEKVYYVRRDKDQSQIVEFNLKSGGKKTIHKDKSKILSLSVSESLIAWTYKADSENEKLIVKKLKNNEVVYQGLEKYPFSDVELHPREMRLLVITNFEDSKNKDVYQVDFAEKCATRFSFHGAEESHPTFGPEGKSFFYVSNRSKSNQVYATLIRPQLTCKPLP